MRHAAIVVALAVVTGSAAAVPTDDDAVRWGALGRHQFDDLRRQGGHPEVCQGVGRLLGADGRERGRGDAGHGRDADEVRSRRERQQGGVSDVDGRAGDAPAPR